MRLQEKRQQIKLRDAHILKDIPRDFLQEGAASDLEWQDEALPGAAATWSCISKFKGRSRLPGSC